MSIAGFGQLDQKAILERVRAERGRQDAKWGVNDPDPFSMVAILSEEVGEAAKEALELRFESRKAGSLDYDDRLRKYVEEMVQVAAVAVKAIEVVERGLWSWGNFDSAKPAPARTALESLAGEPLCGWGDPPCAGLPICADCGGCVDHCCRTTP